jgi:hypothetical protein
MVLIKAKFKKAYSQESRSGMIFACKIGRRSISMKTSPVQTKKKHTSNVCKHKRLIFLGKQEQPDNGDFLALFNCADCHTTISLKMKKKERKQPVKESEPALKKRLVSSG